MAIGVALVILIVAATGSSSTPAPSPSAASVLLTATPSTTTPSTTVGHTRSLAGGWNQAGWGLPRLARALARVAAGGGDMKLLYIGDSTSFGYGATPNGIGPTLSAAQHLATGGYPAALGLSVPVYPGLANADTRWAHTGWSQSINTATWGGVNAAWIGQPSSGTLTFTPGNGYVYDTFDIYYLIHTALGTFNVNVDGGANTLVNSTGPPSVAKVTLTAPAGTAHLVNFSGVTVAAEIIGVEPSLSTVSKIRVANAGVGSTTTAGWTTTTTTTTTLNAGVGTTTGIGPFDSIAAYAPDVSLIRLGINDAASLAMPVKTYLANLLVLANIAKATGDVIISSPTPVQPEPPAVGNIIAGYAAALPAFCLANGFAYIPQFERWGGLGGYAALNPTGFYFDTLHPSATGYADIGTADAAAVLSAR